MASKWFKQRSVQDLEIRKTRKFKLSAFNLIFLGWGTFTLFIVSQLIFKFKMPFLG